MTVSAEVRRDGPFDVSVVPSGPGWTWSVRVETDGQYETWSPENFLCSWRWSARFGAWNQIRKLRRDARREIALRDARPFRKQA